MAKRGAGTELNDRNWDDEEEPEEAGVFAQAGDDIMKERVIKRAKRRGAGDDGSGAKPLPFGGFAGLSKMSQAKKEVSKPIGTGCVFTAKPILSGGASSLNGGEDQKHKTQDGNESSSYLHGLKSLNESVLAWIKQHVEESPYIILTPIFKDYEKYLEKLEAKRSSPSASSNSSKKSDEGASSAPLSSFTAFSKPESKPSEGETGNAKEVTSKPFTFGALSSEAPSKGFSFGTTGGPSPNGGFKFSTSSTASGFTFGSKTESSSSSTAEKTGFGFGLSSSNKTDSNATAEKPSFSFGLSTSTAGGSGFSFGGAAAGSSQGASSQGTKDDDEYVPPKPEVREIKEEGALYSKKCKLYYQKEGAWIDRGIGNVHLKPVEESKTQILVRAETSLGNILLNVMLNSSMPMSRQGKNNVFLVCVPNPPISSKPDPETDSNPVPMLIRVKTGEDADELLKKLEERKELL